MSTYSTQKLFLIAWYVAPMLYFECWDYEDGFVRFQAEESVLVSESVEIVSQL